MLLTRVLLSLLAAAFAWASFTPEPYAPKASLNTLHSMPRVMGSNQISVSGYTTFIEMHGSSFDYAVGVTAPAITMLLFFIVWLLFLCFAKCCCKGLCSETTTLGFFVGSCGMSIIGWFVALAGNKTASSGFADFLSGVYAVQNIGRTALASAGNTTNFVSNLYEWAIVMNVTCNNNTDGVVFPFNDLVNILNQARDTVAQATQDGILARILSTLDRIDTIIVEVVFYLQWREKGMDILFFILIVVVFIFMVTTTLRISEFTLKPCRSVARCSSRFIMCLILVSGILLLIIMWLLAMILQIIVVVGADMCMPNVNINVNNLINEMLYMQGVDGAVVTDVPNVCLNETFRNGAMGVLCYYQTCSGINILDKVLDPLADESKFNVTGEVSGFRIQAEGLGYNLTSECTGSINGFVNEALTITTLMSLILDIVACSYINPVYAKIVYHGLCNGLFDGLYAVFVGLVIGSVFLMFAMFTYCLFDFAKYRADLAPESFYLDNEHGAEGNGGTGDGGPVVASSTRGGPPMLAQVKEQDGGRRSGGGPSAVPVKDDDWGKAVGAGPVAVLIDDDDEFEFDARNDRLVTLSAQEDRVLLIYNGRVCCFLMRW